MTKVSEKMVEGYILIFIWIVVLFKVVASLLPVAQTSGDEINATGISGASLFASNGVLWIIVVLVLFVITIKSFFKGKGK